MKKKTREKIMYGIALLMAAIFIIGLLPVILI